MTALPIGAPAPDFTAEAHTGERITLADYRGRQAVVLYFYLAGFRQRLGEDPHVPATVLFPDVAALG